MAIELISVHFPKAGGTSLLHTYRRAFGEAAVLTDYADDPADPGSRYSLDPDGTAERARLEPPPAQVRVVHGHFHPAKYAHLRNARRVVFLRHPVDTIISIYYFWKTLDSGHALFEYARRENLTLLQTARLPALRHLMSRTYFGGWPVAAFDFIGAMDHYAADLARLSRWLGVPLDESFENRTAFPGYHDKAREHRADPGTIAALHDLLAEDVSFYDQAMRRRAELIESVR